jgi:cell division septation protein DedD
MQGDFDQEEIEPERGDHGEVVTLGFGKLLGLFFILVLVCALCFGGGYLLGRRTVKPSATAAPTTGAEQQSLQPSGAIPKPSAIPPDSAAVPPIATQQDPATGSPSAGNVSAQAATQQGNQPLAASALPPRPAAKQPQQSADSARTTPASGSSFMVQIAAVARPEDADVLVHALRRLKYTVTAQHEDSDNLYHVRMGPFATRGEADEWRTLLANDGYNAVVQQ